MYCETLKIECFYVKKLKTECISSLFLHSYCLLYPNSSVSSLLPLFCSFRRTKLPQSSSSFQLLLRC